jgi:fumarate hydratase class II
VIKELGRRTALPFHEAANHFEAQGSKDAVCFLSATLRNYAIALTKIANDIRWLGAGPRCGIGELAVPATQPGSSIMPGKVNPVIAESVLMACAQVIGHDATIAWCAAGNFELNVMMPVMAYVARIDQIVEGSYAQLRGEMHSRPAGGSRAESFVEQSSPCARRWCRIGYERPPGSPRSLRAVLVRGSARAALPKSGCATADPRRAGAELLVGRQFLDNFADEGLGVANSISVRSM